MLMIKGSYNLGGWESILVYDLKLCLLNWWKNTFVYLELIHLLFWSISNLAMPLVLPKRTHGKSRKVLARLGMHGHEMM